MKLNDLVTALNTLDIPVAFSHFKSTKDNPAPAPPYVTYITPNETDFKADNRIYYKLIDVDIELYTYKKDIVLEQQIEKVLNDNKLPFDAYQIFIESEDVFKKTYEVRLI